MKQLLPYGLLVLVLAFATATTVCADKELAQWKARADTLLVLTDSLGEAATQHEMDAIASTERADSLAVIAARRDTVVRERVQYVRTSVPVPDTCKAIVAGRDSIINDLLAVADTATLAYDEQKRAFAQLQLATRDLRTAVDSLSQVLRDYPVIPWYVPSVDVGAFAGICLDGPCVGVGLGVTWEIPLPFGGK